MNFTNSIKEFKKIDKKILQIVKKGIKISFVFCILASLILLIYCINCNPIIYDIGISVFKTGLFYICTCIMCGFAFNQIGNEIR